MNEADLPTPVEEGRYHTYVGHVIPWYVRVAWIVFWICSAAYVLRYLFPALQRELGSPPRAGRTFCRGMLVAAA